MKIEKENDHFMLIGKYLAGEATPEEAIMLHDWLQDSDNKKEYERIAEMWEQLPVSSRMKEINSLQGWRDLQAALKEEQKSKPASKSWYYYLAAACVIGLVAGIGYILTTHNKVRKVEDKNNQIANIRKSAVEESINTQLPDGSTTTLNKQSDISYSPAFTHSNRELKLAGEAYFNVVPDKKNPFVINVNDLKVEVVGTAFNVKESRSEQKVIVQVESGVVKMYTSQKELFVSKGQTGIYSIPNKELSLLEGIDINSIGYATRSFSFNDLSFVEVTAYLEYAFNVNIQFDKTKFSGCRVSAEFLNKPLTYILDVISATLNITYTQNGKEIIISGNGCI